VKLCLKKKTALLLGEAVAEKENNVNDAGKAYNFGHYIYFLFSLVVLPILINILCFSLTCLLFF
jgi:hypothetical protein